MTLKPTLPPLQCFIGLFALSLNISGSSTCKRPCSIYEFTGYSIQFPTVFIYNAGHSSRAVWGMNCLRSDAGIVGSNPNQGMYVCVCIRLFYVCVFLCLGSCLATGWSLVQGVLPSVKNDYGTEREAWALKGLEEPLKNNIYSMPKLYWGFDSVSQ
jgi:hypothetical protein